MIACFFQIVQTRCKQIIAELMFVEFVCFEITSFNVRWGPQI